MIHNEASQTFQHVLWINFVYASFYAIPVICSAMFFLMFLCEKREKKVLEMWLLKLHCLPLKRFIYCLANNSPSFIIYNNSNSFQILNLHHSIIYFCLGKMLVKLFDVFHLVILDIVYCVVTYQFTWRR